MLQANQAIVHARARDAGPLEPARVRGETKALTGSGLQLSVYRRLSAVEAEWRAFEQEADCTVFQSFDWLTAWQKHIGARQGTKPVIVVGRRAGSPAFILPLAVTARRGIRELTFLGRDLGDYNAPLLAPDFAQSCPPGDFPALWQEICGLLRNDAETRHDLVLLDKMPETIGTQRNPFRDIETRLNPSGAYIATLGGPWETFYVSKRNGSMRKRDRYKRKRLSDHAPVRFVTAEEPGDVLRTFETLVKQKTRSFAQMGVANIFERPGYQAFFAELATDPRTASLAQVSRLEVGDVWAATELGLQFRDRYYYILTSYDDGELSRFGAGTVLLQDLLKRAVERGLHAFDFTIGDEAYKREWCDVELHLLDHVSAASTRGWIVASALNGMRQAKRSIKQNPTLWSLATRVRSALARISGHAAARAAPRSQATETDQPPS